MKTLKVYDDAHTSVKVAAATLGRTTTNIASSALRYVFGQIESGAIKLEDLQSSQSDEGDETATVEA